jgi:hypothetical protein
MADRSETDPQPADELTVLSQFGQRLAGLDVADIHVELANPDGDFQPGPDETLADAVATYRDECQRSRDIVAGASLDDAFVHRGEAFNLRWVLVHMVEETARHNGHADLIREMVDGSVGE